MEICVYRLDIYWFLLRLIQLCGGWNPEILENVLKMCHVWKRTEAFSNSYQDGGGFRKQHRCKITEETRWSRAGNDNYLRHIGKLNTKSDPNLVLAEKLDCQSIEHCHSYIFYAPISVKPEGGWVGHRVWTIKISNPGQKNNYQSIKIHLGQGKAVIYPSVLVAHRKKAINNVTKLQLSFYTEY